MVIHTVHVVSEEKHFLKYVFNVLILYVSPNRLNTKRTKHKFVAKTRKCFLLELFSFLLPTYFINEIRQNKIHYQ